MMNNIDINTIFTLKQDESQLEKMAEKYPWCSVVHLSLLHQYKKNDSQYFNRQLSRTALFFNNHNWMKWQLNSALQNDEKNDRIVSPKDDKELSENHRPFTETNLLSDTTEALSFEPLHTQDYFASQGIKVTDEPITDDKLGSQMKSFTEWLKSMKKIHKEKFEEGDVQTDNNIQQIAEHSNTDAEVVTEAMAEILIQQQKIEKAIAVYQKLSLINPSKSGYFAVKIQSLSADK